MSTRPTIALDIDDTIAGSTECLRLLINKWYNKQLTSEHYGGEDEYWGFYERIWRSHGLDWVQCQEQLSRAMIEDQSDVQVLPDAVSTVEQLSRDHRIIFITSRDISWEPATRLWLTEHFGAVDTELYFCQSHTATTAKTKGDICRELGVSYLIDDNVDHCHSALQSGVKAILFGNYGWHRGVEPSVTRCKDWREVSESFRDAA